MSVGNIALRPANFRIGCLLDLNLGKCSGFRRGCGLVRREGHLDRLGLARKRFASYANAHSCDETVMNGALGDDETVATMGHPIVVVGLDVGHPPPGDQGWTFLLLQAESYLMFLFHLVSLRLETS